MNDGPVTPDLSDVMHVLARIEAKIDAPEEPREVATPRRSADQRIRDDLGCIALALDRIEDAIRHGGSLYPVSGPACIDNFARRLGNLRAYVQTMEAAE